MATGTAKNTAARRLLAGLSEQAERVLRPAPGVPVVQPASRANAPASDDPSTAGPAGLRERKKQRTRQTIVDTAHALFTAHGYDATTIEAIAAGADVSVRTFFRYFASKEEVALAPLDEVGELALVAVERRPAGEPPLAALRAAALDAWVAMNPDPVAFRGYVEHLLIADEAPAVSAAMLARMLGLGDRLAEAITHRFPPPAGPTPGGADLRPLLTAAAFLAAVQVGVRSWFNGGGTDIAEMLAMVEYCVDQLVPADAAPHAAEPASPPPAMPVTAPGPARLVPARPKPADETSGPTAPRTAQPTGPPGPAGDG
ncbi:TetR/AcrR family transcriptional regulator [Frankia sp. CNm7]|uniref:TetR/AcrR family transcriptional regulator n=1 Tax=Frankia nepalensis TaxID=1836974 RepID=A0A937R9E6_9ACTN|nr:TetR/AcrR family transcriptional regulator [Frankia nepalensis]MBL7502118.1 TetR/AcrR family transcriptional regulator [Frankia nepalensis]MBL7512899.1 TetR/AcrR family transcriptional regulator [Frankia nepalensis]MBL7523338.1 TetR/AcrR family transcriptional regulator [Frankia nepalensis]MBL7628098.1 TetR/AcrR family transcriptional regulator [Frankia nepalensis]